jgi:hypothetical protein
MTSTNAKLAAFVTNIITLTSHAADEIIEMDIGAGDEWASRWKRAASRAQLLSKKRLVPRTDAEWTAVESETKKNFAKMKVAELKEILAKMQLPDTSGLEKKDDIVSFLTDEDIKNAKQTEAKLATEWDSAVRKFRSDPTADGQGGD